jgi:oligosaccharyltransferase complex subunit alpha (ribophorin I)
MVSRNVHFTAPHPLSSDHVETHRTFMDTVGRPTIVLVAHNAIEEWRDRGDVVITYDYPWIAGYRKPLTIAGGVLGLFTAAWIIGNIDVRIGKKKTA